ncbi:MAG: ABC transporter ATP-binding protein [Candidatus Limnocylindria bacterium]
MNAMTGVQAAAPERAPALLEVDGLRVAAEIGGASYVALDDVSLTVKSGEARGLVGESGSGKSLTLRAIMGLLPANVSVVGGAIRFKGTDLLADGGRHLSRVRGAGISMVFQEPGVALNPVMRVGRQISDSVARHRGMKRKEAREYAVELMTQVGIKDPARRVDAYPFELSGGMRQRVMIAAAVACGPELILCDEPTTALDVTVQAQILALFAKLQNELHAGLLYVTHDLGVVGQLCDSLSVMYAGRIIEQADDIRKVLAAPRHSYTRALLAAVPRIDGPIRRLEGLANTAPSLTERPQAPAAPLEWVEPGWQVAPPDAVDLELLKSGDPS